MKKHSLEYAPEDGFRYDGIYKVLKYYKEKGASGLNVWRYLLRRDDPAPAQWTKEGKKIAEERGWSVIYPEGYVKPPPKESKKRKNKEDKENMKGPPAKKIKFTIKDSLQELIKKVKHNK